jgi:hypothetical protein
MVKIFGRTSGSPQPPEAQHSNALNAQASPALEREFWKCNISEHIAFDLFHHSAVEPSASLPRRAMDTLVRTHKTQKF